MRFQREEESLSRPKETVIGPLGQRSSYEGTKNLKKEINDVLSDVSSLTDPLRVFMMRTSGSLFSNLWNNVLKLGEGKREEWCAIGASIKTHPPPSLSLLNLVSILWCLGFCCLQFASDHFHPHIDVLPLLMHGAIAGVGEREERDCCSNNF